MQEVLRILETFQNLSELKVNRGKTKTTFFGMSLGKPGFVEQLGIKWRTDFELLGIRFDQILSRMDSNYDKCLKNMKDKLNSLQFRHLTVFW